MNAALLVSCGLFCSQVPIEPVDYPGMEGTHSVLVKITSLGGEPVVGAQTPDTFPATGAESVVDANTTDTVGELTPVPPLGGAESAEIVAGNLEDSATPPLGASSREVPRSVVADTVVPAGAYAVDQSGQSDVSTAAAAESAEVRLAVRLLQSAMSPPATARFGGSHMRLRDLLPGTSDRHAQLQLVSSYWQLAAAAIRYRFAFETAERIGQLSEPTDPADNARLDAARTAAAAALRETELAVVSLQYGLAEAAPLQTAGLPTLPADKPFVGKYETHFESLFARRPVPAGLRRIHHVLPLRLAAIDARAEAVDAAANHVMNTATAYSAGNATLREVLDVNTELRAQQESFVVAVRDYNIDIAAYALAVAGENVAPETLVSMLIPGAHPALTTPAVEYPAVAGATPAILFQGDPRVPTLATPPTGPAPAVLATGPSDASAVGAESVETREAAVTPPQSPEPAAASDESTNSPFRDVTPSGPNKPEVLVPTTPARHRTPVVPAG